MSAPVKAAASLPSSQTSIPTPTSFYVKKITLENAKYLSRRTQRKLIAPYINSFLSLAQIQQLTQDIRIYYIKQGYTTVNVKVALGQNIGEGILQLKVVHGFIEQITLGKNRRREQHQIATAFPLLQGKPLYLRDLEQGIDQLNALTSNHATLKILPGKLAGGSIVQIDNKVTHPFRVDIGLDNLGEKAAGQIRGKVNFALDNLLSINDNFTLHYFTNKPKMVRKKPLWHRACIASFTFPLGTYNFSTTYSTSVALTPIKTTHYTNIYKTRSSSIEVQAKRVAIKRKHHKVTAHLGLVRKATVSFLEDVRMHNQARKLTVCSGGFGYEGVIGGGQCIADITYHQGLPLLGALKDAPSAAVHQPRSQFKKINLELLWIKFKRLTKQAILAYQVKLSSQHTQDMLYNSEQTSIAGLDRVRGFQKNCAGNQGFCMRNELSLYHLFGFSRFSRPLHPFVGLDIGRLFKEKHTTIENPEIAGPWISWACGCRYSAYGLNVDFTYARPIKPKEEQAYCIYFNLTLGLHHIFSSLTSQRVAQKK